MVHRVDVRWSRHYCSYNCKHTKFGNKCRCATVELSEKDGNDQEVHALSESAKRAAGSGIGILRLPMGKTERRRRTRIPNGVATNFTATSYEFHV